MATRNRPCRNLQLRMLFEKKLRKEEKAVLTWEKKNFIKKFGNGKKKKKHNFKPI